MSFLKTLEDSYQRGAIPTDIRDNFLGLYTSYAKSLANDGIPMEAHEHVFHEFLRLTTEQITQPHTFTPYHERLTTPYDYYFFGLEFVRPLIDDDKSCLLHPENVQKIAEQLAKKENVILFANHQTEVDPQLMILGLEKNFADLGSQIIYVAGHRVTTDPVAIPFSLGCNLLCIYSKRHINNPPDAKEKKLQHNQRTMRTMREMLAEGSKCIYVAPSGGRDRPDESGNVPVDPFDSQSIEMFRLMAKKAKRPAHFYPLALATYDILPPPQTVQKELGELRLANRDGLRLSFGDEIDMEDFPGSETQDRHEKRALRATYIWNLVNDEYQALLS